MAMGSNLESAVWEASRPPYRVRYIHDPGAQPGVPLYASYGVANPKTARAKLARIVRSEEHTSELQSLMRISYAVFCLKKKQLTSSYLTDYLFIYTHTTKITNSTT